MFDAGQGENGDAVPGSALPGGPAGRGLTGTVVAPRRGAERPWLAADRGFEEVVADLFGGANLAALLPALLTLEPEVDGPGGFATGDPGGHEPWPGELDAADDSDGTVAPEGPAGLSPGDGADLFGDDTLPGWFVALQRCLEPAGGGERLAVGIGMAPRRAESRPLRRDRSPAARATDEARAARRDGLVSESLGQMTTTAVVEVVAAFKRIEAWAASQAARAAAELASRPELEPTYQRPVPAAVGSSVALQVPALAANTLAKRLGTSEHATGRLVRTGMARNGTLYATGDALAAGEIDWPKAQAMVAALAAVPWHVAHAVEDRVLPRASTRTPGQLRQDIARALLDVDPDDADRRHVRARQERRVERPVPLPDGMALVRAILPADAAVRLDATLQSAARHAKASGDGRRMDQLRADALDALVTHAWRRGTIGDHSDHGEAGDPGTGSEAGTAERMKLAHLGRRAQINVTVDLTTLLGLTRTPGTLSGYGPISAGLARDLARDATWRRLITDPVTGLVADVATTRYRPPANLDELVRLRHPTCIDPVCSVPSDRCDLDHHDAWTPAHPDTSASNLGPLCRTHHLHKTHGGYGYARTGPGTHEITTPTGHRYRTGPWDPPGPTPCADPADCADFTLRADPTHTSEGRARTAPPDGPDPPF